MYQSVQPWGNIVIDLNITLWIQLINFLVTLVVLNYLLIRPVRNIINHRKETVQTFHQHISEFTSKADMALAHYDAALARAREEATLIRKQAKAEAEGVEREMLSLAGKDAQTCLHEAQAAVKAEADKAREALRQDIPAMTKAAMDKLLA